MKTMKWWGLASATAAIVVLAGCAGNGSSSSDAASLRVVNATLTHPSIDLRINDTVSVAGTATDTVSAYVGPASGSNTLQVNDANAGTALATILPTLTGGAHYTLFAYESGGTVKSVVLNEDQALPAAGSAYLRFYNVAVEAGKLDVYITDPSVSLSNASNPVSFTTGSLYTPGYALQGAGTWRVRVTGYGNKNDLRLDMPLVLTSQQVATVVLAPTSGGALLNGSSLLQQSTYATTRNPNVRMRLAAAVSGTNTIVAASAGSAVIDAGSVAPAFGFYTLVPANSALNITAGSASVAAPVTADALALLAGSDLTLLVYGTAAAPIASLIADDNRAPTDTTTVKLRLVNGVTGNAGAITLTANSALVASGVAAAAASGYVSVPGSTNSMSLLVTSSLVSGNFLSVSTPLNSGSVYSVMVGGDAAAPQMMIR